MQKPTVAHLKAAKRLLSYLRRTASRRLCYRGSSINFTLVSYTNSDFAGCRVITKSTFRYLFIVAKGPVSWKSKRSITVALSTLEAEFTGFMEGNREALWLRGLYLKLKCPIEGPIPLFSDNKGAINTAYNPKHYNRTKHTLLKYQGVRESVSGGHITITYVSTTKIPANGLTKALTPTKH